MFSRAAKIRISSTATFYLFTLLLSSVLLSLLRVSTRNFCFGVVTALLAHAAVYLLRRDSVPLWAAVFVLALVVPLFPPEALMPIERGALYWGILAVLLSYTLTYGAHSLLSARDAEGGSEPQIGRRKKRDRHTSELFELLNVTSLSQAIRAMRRLLQERERQQEQAGSAGDAPANAEAATWQRKLRESQAQLKQLRKQLEDARQPRDSRRRQIQDRLEEVQRQMEETVASKDQAVDRAHAMAGFQLRVAELSQQMSAMRGEMLQAESVVQELQARAAEAEGKSR